MLLAVMTFHLKRHLDCMGLLGSGERSVTRELRLAGRPLMADTMLAPVARRAQSAVQPTKR